MTQQSTTAADLPVDAAVELDSVCDAFESAWRSRCRPAIEPAVAALTGDVRAAAVRELIELDVYYRLQAGEHPAPADYADRFPDLDPAWLKAVTRSDLPTLSTLTAGYAMNGSTGGWTRPPLLRDDPSDHTPIVRPFSADMPKADPARLQLFGEIARGGMGVILKGRDPALGRDLAIKVLKAEYAGRAMAEERFVEEAQVGGQLQHPGIVPVYELSRFADGRPFFTMKLVKGRTFAALLAGRKTPADDRGRFLQHFLKVCDTIAYAHSRGVVHRDLKPANVMVGSFGEVQVMDWGLAKVLPRGGVADERLAGPASNFPDDSENEPTVIETVRVGSGGSDTQAGSVLGTPAYMPPEQAGGEIDKLDERADVFGLGAMLCVILTGQPPYLADTAEATRLMAIRGELGEAFARLDAAVGDRDLVELCKRCLSAKQEGRPRHAGEVADAMKAYLETVEDRAHRAEVERAQAEATAAGDRKRHRIQRALAASLLGLVLLGGGTAWWVQSQRAARAAEVAKERNETEVIIKDAIDNANRALDEGRWIDAAASIQRGEDRLGAGNSFPGFRTALNQARADRDMAMALERAHGAGFDVSDDQRRSSSENANVTAVRAAFEAYGFPAWDMEADAIKERLRVSRIGRLLTEELVDLSRKERKSGEYIFPRLYGTMDLLDDDPYRRKLSDACKRQDTAAVLAMAEDPALRDQPAMTVTRVVQYLKEKDQPGTAAALRNIRLILLAHPNDVILHEAMSQLLFVKGRPEDRAEAIGYSKVVVALRPQSARAAVNLGARFGIAGVSDAAEAMYREAIRLDPRFALPRINLGSRLLARRDLPEAEAEFREVVRFDPQNAPAHYYLGIVLHDKRDLPGAEAEFREAFRLDPHFARAHNDLGIVLHDKRDLPGAEAEFREAFRLDPHFDGAHYNLGNLLLEKRDLPGAEAEYREAIRLDPNILQAHVNLGILLAKKGDSAGAEAEYREAIRLDQNFFAAHVNLGSLLQTKGNLVGAEAEYRDAIRIDPNSAAPHINLGLLLRQKRDLPGAEAEFREAIRLDQNFFAAHVNLGFLLQTKGNLVGAQAEYREGIRLFPKSGFHHNELAWLLATGPEWLRDGKQAVQLATRACELTGWKNVVFIDTLAAAYAEVGEFEKAIETEKKALALPNTEKQYGTKYRNRIALYEQKKPYRDPYLARRELAPQPRAGK
jgi:serine/threonine-protein kinase